tara:strand:- start:2034 stop:2606 length:573 start_codon:yes stop_codon:yes gene_type:complete
MINKLNPLLSVFIFVYILTTPLFAQDTSVTKPQIGTTQKIGDILLFTLPVATFSTTLIIGDKQGSWQFTKGFLLTSAVTYGLKLGVNKQRPDMSNDNSFPSGHTSTTFQSAGFIHKRYGFKYSIPAYAIAGFTAASRIDSKKHDILDVLAGAAIGLGSNLLFTTEYQQKHMELTFYSNRKEFLVGFNYNF